ncbi:unnamed protein product [Cylicostephanus goldi]|uniref:Uncharacterized protein n=1 Tax=Cylicostephanus goldi TaxID=71465 RepID=A0A3P6TJR4_CYLGO|nr:unnamed protein product [Cylicostephanus goldi]
MEHQFLLLDESMASFFEDRCGFKEETREQMRIDRYFGQQPECSRPRYQQRSVDQLSKRVQKFVSYEDTDNRKRDVVLMKLDEGAYRKYADEVLPAKPHNLDLSTTIGNLQELFPYKKTLIRRRLE